MKTQTLLPAETAAQLLLADAVQHAEAGIVSRTVVQTAEFRVVLFAFAPGQELTAHSSRRRALVQVLAGECDFFFAGAWHRLQAGSLLHLPPDHPHAVRAAAGAFSMLLTLGADAAATAAA